MQERLRDFWEWWETLATVSATWLALIFLFLAFTIAFQSGCASREGSMNDEASLSLPCKVALPRFPTSATDFQRLYHNRGFYTDGNHLGRDIELPEAQAIHPIGCGVIRVYRPAQGYGTLVVVIEHELAEPRLLRNGLNENVPVKRFLSIYGHLRPRWLVGAPALPWKPGDKVMPEDVIGFIENASDNGDGDEHLHLGIRLQGQVEAERSDTSWFRGYDATPSQRRWFADPATALSELMTKGIKVSWHPPGTILSRAGNTQDRYRVNAAEELEWIAPSDALADRLIDHAISVSDDELSCFRKGNAYRPEWPGARAVQFNDSDAIYQARDVPSLARGWFASHEALRSWGWKAAQIVPRPPSERPWFFEQYTDFGALLLREGTLIKTRGSNEVSVISNSQRRPIYDWATFSALGYQAEWIQELESNSLVLTYYETGPVITPQMVSECAYSESVADGSSTPDMGMEAPDLIRNPPDLLTLPDLTKPPPPPPPPPMPWNFRYEFRVLDAAGWQASEPFRLRNQWWAPVECDNTGSVNLADVGNGWHRCDLRWYLIPFVGSFFSKAHPNWGDQGNIGTVGNAPQRCTPTNGVEWRLTDLRHNFLVYQGSSAGLPCTMIGDQDRHLVPEP